LWLLPTHLPAGVGSLIDDGSRNNGQDAYTEQLFGKMDAHGFFQSDIKIKIEIKLKKVWLVFSLELTWAQWALN